MTAEAKAELTGKQRRHLRALGHHLTAVVQVGHEGVTPAVVHQTRAQLLAHELIKVKVVGEGQDRHTVAETLAGFADAHLAQVLGKTILLYKKRPKNPEIVLPK